MRKKDFFSILDAIDQIPFTKQDKHWIIADDIDNPKIITVVNEKDMGLNKKTKRKPPTVAS